MDNSEDWHIEGPVLVTKTGELFLVGGQHPVFVKDSSQELKIEDSSKNNLVRNISNRKAIFQKKDILYKHVVFPDKHNVYSKQFPIDVESLMSKYIGHPGYPSDDVIYPIDRLQELGKPSFIRTETHMTEYACHELAHYFLSEIDSQFCTPKLSLTYKNATIEGDLGTKLQPKRYSIIEIASRPKGIKRWTNGISGNDGLMDIYQNINTDYRKRILIFGDSFFRTIAEFMAMYSPQVTFCRSRYVHYELVTSIKPDIVFSGNVERYLSFVNSDAVRPNFLLYPQLNNQQVNPSEGFWKALNALLSYGRPGYKAFFDGTQATE
ncbi:MAG: hypothetical protein KDI33_00740 [Halioglobus sp.]|nr:hypothetical protein [Halioglobus sp.]